MSDNSWPSESHIDSVGLNGEPINSWDNNGHGNNWMMVHGHRLKERTSPTYITWIAMKARCSDDSNKNYGARGISVCDAWRDDFSCFLADMGERPEGMTIDRIDPDGDYCPDNCRWANSKEQARNRKSTVIVNVLGNEYTLTELSNATGVPSTTLSRRIKKGLTGVDLITRRNLNYKIVGENVHSSKLNWEKVREIRLMLDEGVTQKRLSEVFGVSQSVISDIRNNKSWVE